MSVKLLITAVYQETYKNMKPYNPCRRGRLSALAENFVVFEEEEEDNTNGENE
jgi:hypothetical protein